MQTTSHQEIIWTRPDYAPPIGAAQAEIDTPALLLDLDTFESNARTLAEACRAHGVDWRPHSKAHKSPQIAHRLLELGAIGLTCAKLAEAEMYLSSGVPSVLIANTIVTPAKLQRLAALQAHGEAICAADNADVVAAAAAAGVAVGNDIPMVVDVNVGMNRTGVDTVAAALALGRLIDTSPGLSLRGIMGYEGHVLSITPRAAKVLAHQEALGFLNEVRTAFADAGLSVAIVSAGGTGCYDLTAAYPGVTEIQAGGGVFMDAMYRSDCNVADLQPALSVLATVTSRRGPTTICDAGFKTLSAFHRPPECLSHPNLEFVSLSAEHGNWNGTGPGIGGQIELLLGYSDSTILLHERIVGMRSGRVEAIFATPGRGLLQ
jgi:D-serine deaminase-like pyridoxal phosphate-dependent protein